MRIVLPMPGNEAMANALAVGGAVELGAIETRRFPDSEAYVRLASDVRGRDVDIVCTLAHPDEKFLGLIFAASTARELGAKSVRLIAPYLAYMRQDKRFRDGEAVSSAHFARILSQHFDHITTVDPHLHRRTGLGEIFSIPTYVAHAAPLLADWIAANIERPLIIGPDVESEQWAAEVAARARAPHVALSKERRGDRDVRVSVPDLSSWLGRMPVLIDDIISSGHTMIEAARQITYAGFARPHCFAVHALFADGAYAALAEITSRVLTTDTVPHPSNAVSVAPLLTGLDRMDGA